MTLENYEGPLRCFTHFIAIGLHFTHVVFALIFCFDQVRWTKLPIPAILAYGMQFRIISDSRFYRTYGMMTHTYHIPFRKTISGGIIEHHDCRPKFKKKDK